MNIKKLTNSENQITAIHVDDNYLWAGFKDNGIITLKKLSSFNPNLVYFEIDIESDEITAITTDSSNVYIALDSSDYLGARLSKTNPLLATNYYNKPNSINEKAIDLIKTGSYMFILTPGEISGEYSNIIKYFYSSSDNTKIINLTTIRNVKTITAKSDDELWIGTYTDPITLVKVYGIGGGDYNYIEWNIQ